MPLFNKDREDPQAPELAETAEIRTHLLTEELLDWLLAALVAVLVTPECNSDLRVRESLVRAMKDADRLYPHTLKAYDEQVEPDPVA